MLQDFRDNLKGTAFFIVILISIPFALVGIDQIFQGGSAGQMELSVNGEDITGIEVDRALARHKQRLVEQYEGLDPALLDDELLRKPVQYGLVREKVVSIRAMDLGMEIEKEAFSKLITSAEPFQQNGRFDRDTYGFVLSQMGHTQSTYYAEIKDRMLIAQMALGVAGTGIVTPEEAELSAALIEQKRDYYYVTVPIAQVQKTINLDDKAVEEYYQANQQDFATEEKIIVDYLELKIDDLLSDIDIDEATVREQFDAELKQLISSARRRVEHILFADDDDTVNQNQLAEVQKKLTEGATFGELAQVYSDDLGTALQGGDLGFIDPTGFPQNFLDVVAKLSIGEVSAPLETESGIHLIRLVDKEATTEMTFETERSRIRRDLEGQSAEQLLPDKIDQLRELAYNAETLSEVGEAMALTLQTSEAFPRSGGSGIASFPSVVKAAFDPEVFEKGHASEVIEIGPTHIAIVKLKELIPASTLALELVRDDIVTSLKMEQARAIVEAKGSDILEKAKGGVELEALAKQEELSWQASIDTRRYGGLVDGAIRDHVFALPVRGELPRVTGFVSDNGDYIVLSLTKVTPGKYDQLAVEQRDNLLGSIRANVGLREYQSYQSSLFDGADIEGLN